MSDSFKLSKLKHDLKSMKQSPDETHQMYHQRYANLEFAIKSEVEKLETQSWYQDMVQERVAKEKKKLISSILLVLFLFILFIVAPITLFLL